MYIMKEELGGNKLISVGRGKVKRKKNGHMKLKDGNEFWYVL